MDRSFGTSFFLSDIFIQGEVLHYQGGSPVLYEHLFWFLGHPEVYIVLLPALGITSEIIATNSRKPIFGYRAMVASILAIAFLSTIVWGHHMFISGMNPFLGSVFTFTTLLIAIPSAVKALIISPPFGKVICSSILPCCFLLVWYPPLFWRIDRNHFGRQYA